MIIFMYHGFLQRPLAVGDACFIEKAKFLSQLCCIKRNFRVLSLLEAVEFLTNGDECGRRIPAAITIDDGFQSSYEIAYPILRKMGIPATVFPVSGLVGTENTLWYCRLHEAITKTDKKRLRWGNRIYGFGGARSRARCSYLLQERLKYLSHNELLQAVETISLKLGVDPCTPVPGESPFRMLSAEAISSMATSGLIDFGAHTDTHPILSRISRHEQGEEISRSMRKISGFSGRPCYFFAYPNGTSGDFSGETVSLLRSRNFVAAVTTTWGANHKDTPLMTLKRCGFDARAPQAWFRLQAKWLAMPPASRAQLNPGFARSLIHRLVRRRRKP